MFHWQISYSIQCVVFLCCWFSLLCKIFFKFDLVLFIPYLQMRQLIQMIPGQNSVRKSDYSVLLDIHSYSRLLFLSSKILYFINLTLLLLKCTITVHAKKYPCCQLNFGIIIAYHIIFLHIFVFCVFENIYNTTFHERVLNFELPDFLLSYWHSFQKF